MLLVRRLSESAVLSMALLLILALVSTGVAAPVADSAVLFIVDGMGPVQIQVARDAVGGEPLAMERTPSSGLVTTQAAHSAVTDSAAAATALATGHKTDNGMISKSPEGCRLATILEVARRMYKSVGVVTTDAPHGATSAAFVAHANDRGMSADIAAQIADSDIQVVMGYGKSWYLPESAGGERTDGRDLVAEWGQKGYEVVFTQRQLANSTAPILVGLFEEERRPRLAEMVEQALKRLARDPDGFFLVVEGAWTDGYCHVHDPVGAVASVLELDEAVSVALKFAKERGHTLVLVTADHETGGMVVVNSRRASILGSVDLGGVWNIAGLLVEDRSNLKEVMAERAGIRDLTPAEAASIQDAESTEAAVSAIMSARAGVAWGTYGHTCTPVRIFAHGPGAHRFTGEMDNTDVPVRVAEVLDLGTFACVGRP